MSNTAVRVHAADPILAEGLRSLLRREPGLEVVDAEEARPGAGTVTVLGVDGVEPRLVATLRALQQAGPTPVVVVAGTVSDGDVQTLKDAGAISVLRRCEVGASIGAHLVRLNGGQPAPNDDPLTPRERDVLRLVSEGYDTAEIASTLCFSERTIKSVIHGVTERLGLRNRPHAIAHAMKRGWL